MFGNKSILMFASLIFLVVADLGLVTSYDGVIFGTLLSVVMPGFSPYVALLMASVQDLPGVATPSVYIGYSIALGICMLTVAFKTFATGGAFLRSYRVEPLFFYLVAAAIILICYGFLISALRGLEQSETRSYPLVTLFMIFNVLGAIASAILILSDPEGMSNLKWVMLLCVFHGVLALILQLTINPAMFRSDVGLQQIFDKEAGFMLEEQDLGKMRLMGVQMSPNTVGYVIALQFMLAIRSYGSVSMGYAFILAYFLIGAFQGVMTMSRSEMFFSLGSTVALMTYRNKNLLYATIVAMALGMVILFTDPKIAGISLEDIAVLFRSKPPGDLGVREILWKAVIREFRWDDWLFGVGLSYWRVFFGSHAGIPAADPHTYLLSAPGMFGILGTLFYIFTAIVLISVFRGADKQKGLIALLLILIIFFKDLVSYPCFIQNSPLSFLIWLNVALAMMTGPHEGRLPAPAARRTNGLVAQSSMGRVISHAGSTGAC